MSRSNPTDGTSNPCTRWFEWKGGDGVVSYYDKETKADVVVGSMFQCILLDQVSTVKGWHDGSGSGIYANEVRDTKQDVLVVRAFKGGILAEGVYSSIRDRIGNLGGKFVASCYIGYKGADGLAIGNLALKGAALGAWMEFQKACPRKKDADGKSIPGYYADAVKIDGYDEGKKGSIVYRTPKFSLAAISAESNEAAVALDGQLQAYLSDYLKRPRVDAASVAAAYAPTHEERSRDHDGRADEISSRIAEEFIDDDIPF